MKSTWRVGRRNPHNVYVQWGDEPRGMNEPDGDTSVGYFRLTGDAEIAVAAVNAMADAEQAARPAGDGPRDPAALAVVEAAIRDALREVWTTDGLVSETRRTMTERVYDAAVAAVPAHVGQRAGGAAGDDTAEPENETIPDAGAARAWFMDRYGFQAHQLVASDLADDEVQRHAVAVIQAAAASPRAGADTAPDDEEAQLVEQALHCADTGEAGHWPTAAGFLAHELRRLRSENAALRAAGDELAAAADALGINLGREHWSRLRLATGAWRSVIQTGGATDA